MLSPSHIPYSWPWLLLSVSQGRWMMAAMGRYILFSGCGVEHDRTAVRSSILALADIMRMDLVEAPLTLCCGARADRGCGKPDARHLLAPLLAAAWDGRSIVC